MLSICNFKSADKEKDRHKYRDNLQEGMLVEIIKKEDQSTGKKTKGKIKRILTRSKYHPQGIKVMLTTGEIGRVIRILDDKE